MPPGPTPTNSGARAARTEEANQTPREHKAADRDRGNDNFRRDEDNKMVNGKRWVQVTVDTFMDTWSYAVAAGWTVKSVAELDGLNKPYQNAAGTGKVTSQAVVTGSSLSNCAMIIPLN